MEQFGIFMDAFNKAKEEYLSEQHKDDEMYAKESTAAKKKCKDSGCIDADRDMCLIHLVSDTGEFYSQVQAKVVAHFPSTPILGKNGVTLMEATELIEMGFSPQEILIMDKVFDDIAVGKWSYSWGSKEHMVFCERHKTLPKFSAQAAQSFLLDRLVFRLKAGMSGYSWQPKDMSGGSIGAIYIAKVQFGPGMMSSNGIANINITLGEVRKNCATNAIRFILDCHSKTAVHKCFYNY
jgi:hypothetical protein